MRAAVAAAWLSVSLAATLPAGAQQAADRAIDPAASNAHFSIAHIFVSRVTGTVPIVAGTVVLPSGEVIPTSVEAQLDATKLHTDDPDRDASLAGPDYFDAKQYPTWTFASTKIVATGANAFAMDGTLTIHGVAQPEHLDVSVRGDAAHPLYHAIGHIDRRAFGMKGTRLDPVIGSAADVTLDVALR